MYFQDAARAAAIVAVFAIGASASQQTGRRPQFVVAMLNEAAVSPNVIKSAQASLIAIFEAIGVAAVWADRYAGDRTVLVVRIVDEKRPTASRPCHAQSVWLLPMETSMAGSPMCSTLESSASRTETDSIPQRCSALSSRTSSGICFFLMGAIATAA